MSSFLEGDYCNDNTCIALHYNGDGPDGLQHYMCVQLLYVCTVIICVYSYYMCVLLLYVCTVIICVYSY